ncbi:uncharacterized protein LOC114748163 [Neltuma alba]|uniref:uncharacterized protein LOC114731999 n=1 Tax=Neltuma alba TaxID=207710 RepID=UPI0010A39FE9|nr:uncharacterized protein LOC114731999 [Prosopis alba]XP_028792350.1 uncharacterized protein LOC114748163 [Prosopis alba]
MSLLRAALRSNSTFPTLRECHGFPPLLRATSRIFFSSEAEQPPQDPQAESFLRTPREGLAYGRLLGVRNYTLKTDIIHFLKGCNLTTEDVKVDYGRYFTPLAMMLQFHSYNDYDRAVRHIARNGRLYRLDRTDRAQWDVVTPYDGKTILMRGFPRNALIDEIERFLHGYEYDQTSINIFLRQGETFGNPVKMATVRFRSRTEAMSAFITKNKTFCLNSPISIMVLQ